MTTTGVESIKPASSRGSMDKANILIINYGPVIQEGLRAMFGGEESIGSVDVVSDEDDLLEALTSLRPDAVFTEMRMAHLDALGVLKLVQEAVPHAAVIVLTASENDAQVIDAIEAGAQGYLLLREATLGSLLDAIHCTRNDSASLKTSLLQTAMASLSARARSSLPGVSLPVDLTAREVQVLNLVAEGRTNHEIGQRLSLSVDTVKGNVRSIVHKLNARGRTHAVAIATHAGLLRPEGILLQ